MGSDGVVSLEAAGADEGSNDEAKSIAVATARTKRRTPIVDLATGSGARDAAPLSSRVPLIPTPQKLFFSARRAAALRRTDAVVASQTRGAIRPRGQTNNVGVVQI